MVKATKVHVLCTLTPVEGKADEFRQLLKELAKKVEEEETHCIGYQIWEMKGENRPIFKLLERWESQEALDNHSKREWLHDIDGKLEKISAKPQVIEPVELLAGYAERQ